jgi:hypothetical protein
MLFELERFCLKSKPTKPFIWEKILSEIIELIVKNCADFKPAIIFELSTDPAIKANFLTIISDDAQILCKMMIFG